jgi:hypothetical protein
LAGGTFRELILQKAGVADESRLKDRGSDIEIRMPMEKYKMEYMGPKKSPECTKGGFSRQPAGSFL